MRFRPGGDRLSPCSRVFARVRNVVAALKLEFKVSAPFRLGSDDHLGVFRCSWRSRACRDAKSSSAGTISIRIGLVVTSKVTTFIVDTGCCDAKCNSFGTI